MFSLGKQKKIIKSQVLHVSSKETSGSKISLGNFQVWTVETMQGKFSISLAINNTMQLLQYR